MDEIEVFNRALSQTEIQSIYNAASAGNCQTPSLSITEKGGKTLFKCRAGCEQGAVLAALCQRGLWEPTPKEADRGSRIVATYNYCDAEGALRYQVVKLAPKRFFQRRPNGAEDSFINNMVGVEPLPSCVTMAWCGWVAVSSCSTRRGRGCGCWAGDWPHPSGV